MPDETTNSEKYLVIQQLSSIQNTVQELSRKQDIQNVKLFGEEGGPENARGRLPLIESTQANHGTRLDKVESWVIRASVWQAVGSVIISAIIVALFNRFIGK